MLQLLQQPEMLKAMVTFLLVAIYQSDGRIKQCCCHTHPYQLDYTAISAIKTNPQYISTK